MDNTYYIGEEQIISSLLTEEQAILELLRYAKEKEEFAKIKILTNDEYNLNLLLGNKGLYIGNATAYMDNSRDAHSAILFVNGNSKNCCRRTIPEVIDLTKIKTGLDVIQGMPLFTQKAYRHFKLYTNMFSGLYLQNWEDLLQDGFYETTPKTKSLKKAYNYQQRRENSLANI